MGLPDDVVQQMLLWSGKKGGRDWSRESKGGPKGG